MVLPTMVWVLLHQLWKSRQPPKRHAQRPTWCWCSLPQLILGCIKLTKLTITDGGGIKYTKIAYIKFILPLNILNIIFIKIITDYKSILWGRIFQQPRKPYKSRNKKNWPRYTSENYQLRKEKILTFLWCSLPSMYTPRDLFKTGPQNPQNRIT